jgi:hypothetical protein
MLIPSRNIEHGPTILIFYNIFNGISISTSLLCE